MEARWLEWREKGIGQTRLEKDEWMEIMLGSGS